MLKREQANTPQKIEFNLPDDKKTYSIGVLSTKSDQYRFLYQGYLRGRINSPEDDRPEFERAAEEEAKILSFAVCEWEMPESYGEFSPESAYQLLLDYPEIRDSVNYFIGNESNYQKK